MTDQTTRARSSRKRSTDSSATAAPEPTAAPEDRPSVVSKDEPGRFINR